MEEETGCDYIGTGKREKKERQMGWALLIILDHRDRKLRMELVRYVDHRRDFGLLSFPSGVIA